MQIIDLALVQYDPAIDQIARTGRSSPMWRPRPPPATSP